MIGIRSEDAILQRMTVEGNLRMGGFIPAARSKQVKKAELEVLASQEQEINEQELNEQEVVA